MYKLIIIDDEVSSAQLLGSAIVWQDYGFELCRIFSRSSDGAAYLKANHVDLVLTDIRMPEYSGMDIAGICQSLSPKPYVVFMSAYSEFEYARQALKLNIFDYLIKPFSYTDIEDILKRVYDELEKRNLPTLFTRSMGLVKHQYVFAEMFLSGTPSDEYIKDSLKSIDLPPDISDNKCAQISITINNFDEYISNIWKYGEARLYNALSYLTSSRNTLYCCGFSCVGNTLRIVTINLSGDFESNIESYIARIKKNLETYLSISDTIADIRIADSLTGLIKNSPEEDNPEEDKPGTEDPIIRKSIDYIKANYSSEITLDEVANHVSLSRVYFCSYFKKYSGENFIDTLNRYRIDKAKELLISSELKISSIAEEVGYKSVPYFYKIFDKFTTLSPSEYRKKFRREQSL